MGDDPLSDATKSNLIAIEQIQFQRRASSGDRNALFSLEAPRFSLDRGQRIALAGPSGSGKTTLLRLLALTLRPASAARFVVNPADGAPVDVVAAWARGDARALDRLRARFVGASRHGGDTPSFLTARDAVLVRMRLAGRHVRKESAEETLEKVGLGSFSRRTPGHVSQGQRQRVGVASALCHSPSVVIADEPTAALDGDNAERVMSVLAETADLDAGVVISTHDPMLAQRHGFTIVSAEIEQGQNGDAITRFATAF